MQSRRLLLQWTFSLSGLGAFSVRSAVPLVSGTRRLDVLLFDRREIWESFPPELNQALAALGWVDGTNLQVRWHFAAGDQARLMSLVALIVGSKPDAILTRGTPSTLALHRATTKIPILTGLGDPIGSGFAKTFAAPGGNVTGISFAAVESSRKQVELLRALVPGLVTLLILVPGEKARFETELTRPVKSAVREAGLRSRTVLIGNAAELEAAFRPNPVAGRMAAVSFALPSVEPRVIAELALAAGMPIMFPDREYVESGGLASYRFYWDDQTRRTAEQIDKVFRGENPAQIPFEMPTHSEFVVNRKTAKSLGLLLHQTVLLRADVVIE